MDFEKQFAKYKKICDSVIERFAAQLFSPSDKLLQAMRYSLLSGGKRLRSVMLLAAAEESGGTIDLATEHLCFAVEALHTYTLIHDDLPCMDDDSERRGMPACHIKFGEAHALLAGDALLNASVESALKAVLLRPELIRAVDCFFAATGMQGTIAGQSIEFELEDYTKDDLLRIAYLKTSKLFEAPLAAGGICGGADELKLAALKNFGDSFGLAFQLKDDLDDNSPKGFAAVFGAEKAAELLEMYKKKAIDSVAGLGYPFLSKLVERL